MKRNYLLSFLFALTFSSSLHAELSSLSVAFTPNASVFTVGDTINIAATANGANTQYRFIFDKVVGTSFVSVSKSLWSTNGTYQIDTAVLNLPVSEYRLTVYSREAANKKETLTKTEYFTLAAAPTACELIDGVTFTNASPQSPTRDLGCPGFLCLNALDVLTAGTSQTTAANGQNMVSFAFQSGAVSVVPANINLTSGLGGGVMSPAAALAGTYTCSANTVTVTASGTGSLSGSSGLMSLFSGQTLPWSVSGSLTINSGAGSLTAGGATFE